MKFSDLPIIRAGYKVLLVFCFSLVSTPLLFAQLFGTNWNDEKSAVPLGGSEVEVGDTIVYTIRIDDIYRNGFLEYFLIEDVVTPDLDFQKSDVRFFVETKDGNGDILRTDRTTDIFQSDTWCDQAGNDIRCRIPECGAGNPFPCVYEPVALEFQFPTVVNSEALNNLKNANGEREVCNTAFITERNKTERRESFVCHILKEPITTKDIQIEKSAFPPSTTSVSVGQIFTYFLTLTNNETEDFQNIVVQDTIADDLTLVGFDQNRCSWDSTTRILSCLFNNVPQSSTQAISFDVQVKDTTQTSVCNNASFELQNETYTSNTICHDIAHDIDIIKSSIPPHDSEVRPFETIQYTLTLKNPTDSPLVDQVIRDVIHPDFMIDPSSIPTECQYDQGTREISCNLSVLQKSETSVSFLVVLNNTQESRICNTAQTDIQGQTVVSFSNCINVGADVWNFTKTANPASGDSIGIGEMITYTLTIKNTEELISETLVVTDTVNDNLEIVDALLPSECSHQQNTITCTLEPPLFGRDTRSIDFSVRVKDTASGVLENKGILTFIDRPLLPVIESNSTQHPVRSGDSIVIQKSSNTQTVRNNDNITYTLEVQNQSQVVVRDIVVQDTLSSEIGILTISPSSCENIQNQVRCEFTSLAPNETRTVTINGKVKEAITLSAQICNTAEGIYEGTQTINSNTVCVTGENQNSGGGSNGGGSAPVTPTVGTCAAARGSGEGWECVPRYPKAPTATHQDPFYEVYETCKKDTTQTETDCLLAWADASGFTVCGATNPSFTSTSFSNLAEYFATNPKILVPYSSGDADLLFQNASYDNRNNGKEILNHQCTAKQVIYTDGNTGGGSNTTQCVTPNDAPEVSMTLKKTADKSVIARGDEVTYTVTVTPQIINQKNVTITKAELRIYDYTVPHDSGKIWHRDGILNDNKLSDSYQDWTLAGSVADGIVFTKDITTTLENTHTITYSMDSELALTSDIAQLKNTSFARLILFYETTDADGNIEPSKTLNQLFGFDETGTTNNICGNPGALDPSTTGSAVIVNVIRPVLDTQGGGNIGGLEIKEDEEKLFGDPDTIRNIIREELQNIEIKATPMQRSRPLPMPNELKPSVIEDIQEKATRSETFFNTSFETTQADSGVYFGNSITLSDEFDAEKRSKTFVIDGDVTITKNFTIQNGFAAFIINGNLIIEDTVDRIEGLFVVQNGTIQGGTDSKQPLTISGGLIGDARDLIGKRRFIGENPETTIEPSITILFDIRLLEQTPPALQDYLGGNWQQVTQ